jgi:hypothetical protein
MTTSAAWPIAIALMSSWTIDAVIGRIGQTIATCGRSSPDLDGQFLTSAVNFFDLGLWRL